MFKRLQPHHLAIIESGLVGVFFIQAVRFLIGMIYSRVAGASAVSALQAAAIPIETSVPVPDPALVGSELTFLIYMLFLPALTLLFGRFRALLPIAVILVALGRVFMMNVGIFTPTAGAAIALGGGLVYIVVLARWRAAMLPYMFVIGFAVDQLFRAAGNTVDPSWSSRYLNVQIALSIAAVGVSLIIYLWERRAREAVPAQDYGLLPFWGAIGLSGLLYLELSLLALPNAITGRTDTDYATFVPFVLVATLLPLVPAVRGRARAFIDLFDPNVRGWLWMLIVAILLVIGTRVTGVIGGGALVLAQFLISLTWWWLVRPRAERERSFAGLWIIFGVLLFALLLVGDNFTFEYAYVRDFTGDLAFLNRLITPLLRAFRGFGLGLLLFAVFLAVLPLTQMQRRIPWNGGRAITSLVVFLMVVAASLGAAYAARPPVIAGVRGVEEMRVGTYNIHGGYDEFYNYDLEAVARTIQQSGSNVVLLQEVEAGRLSSFGVDQALWLARRLGMDRRFLATNEGIQGLAVLSNMEIAFDDGMLLASIGTQTGVQRVQVLPNANAVVTFYNTWLSPLLDIAGEEGLGEQEQDQQRQLNELFATYIGQACNVNLGYTVIGGTFHNVPDSPLAQGLRNAGFSDPFSGMVLERSATLVRTGLPRARFDYLWTCLLPSSGAGVMETNASDHRMIFTQVVLTRQVDG